MGSVWRCGDRELPLGERTLVMGIVNVTPDSFSDGGMFDDADDAVKHGLRLLHEGADLLDVGGESTRPGSDPVSADEERRRVLPVIQRLRREAPQAVLSVDTRKAEVAKDALAGGGAGGDRLRAGGPPPRGGGGGAPRARRRGARPGGGAGAGGVTQRAPGADPEMFGVVAPTGAGIVLMHMRGEPKTMQDDPSYDDVVAEVRTFLAERIEAAVVAGIGRDRICIDPGIGFGKGLEHNLQLLRAIGSFRDLGVPVLAGVSRKRFIGTLSGAEDPGDRLEGTLGAVAWCAGRGVDVVRVHDVAQTSRALRVVDAIARGEP